MMTVARLPRTLLLTLLVILWIGAITEASSSKATKANVPAKSTITTSSSSSTKITTSSPSIATSSSSLISQVWFHTRRILNLSNTFGSATLSATPYDRIASHPVFSITTPWGSPYMNMEKLNDLTANTNENSRLEASTSKKVTSAYEEQNEFRSVVLYFLDPDDALAVHGEMKQMDSMSKSDVRITTTSLAKALRQAANLGHGAPTGIPLDPLDGTLPVDDGGALRYKLVPPKRQLFYAARCVGKERVGLFADVPAEDAQMCVIGNSAIEGTNLMKRREQRERKFPKQPKNAYQAANMHMEGYTGIPVFYCPELHKQVPTVKRLFHLGASPKQQVPLFFNYEDLMDAWTTMRTSSSSAKTPIPETPTSIEVYNLWDVLTSMERDAWQKKHRLQALWKQHPKDTLKSIQSSIQTTLSSSKPSETSGPDLNAITFVPSSRSIQYKEAISARGNGKARLRPMR